MALAPPASPVPYFGASPKTPIGSLLERSMLVIFFFFTFCQQSIFARSQSFRNICGPTHNSPLLLALHMTFRCRSKVARFQDPLQAWMSMKLKTLMVSVLSERRGGGGLKATQWTTWARPCNTGAVAARECATTCAIKNTQP